MQYIAFFVVAIGAYFVSDWIMNQLERRRGERFEYRQIYFMFLLLGIAMAAFEVVGRLAG
ncbi:MAG: hypothetical protein HOE62_02540 [Alphaproteobacteria bacterium]|jgi:hypothetical protein|nr:hypothetical protein [Alphaproteobacteria bacterium]MBT4016800.1 hypothetical protein [Alphaproteobacteria bacterium]MBT5159865.1 hypothetical protein [Alphaproteobacteria bacterium]MBT6387674.1 hypothetical protein [Alphaproteobacteria bacterium]